MVKKGLLKVMIITAISFVVCISAFSQTDPQFTQYVFNHAYLNPAAAGFGGKTNISAIYRTQWTGYTGTFDSGGAPNSQLLTASAPLSFLNGGVSAYFLNDQLGGGSATREFELAYSYHKRFGANIIGAGISAGMHNRSINGTNYRPRETNDPVIPTSQTGQTKPDLGAGIYLYNPVYQLGLSVKHINQPAFGLSTESGNSLLPRSLYLTGNVLIGLSYTLDVSPMFVIKSDFKTVSPEAGAIITYNANYWAGLNYRWQDAFSFLIGGNFLNSSLRAGYAVDWIVFGNLAKAPLSHEILLTYSLNPPRAGKKSIIRTPRYRY